jgi:Rrf2 family protein
MRLSHIARCAVRALVYLQGAECGKPLAFQAIARPERMPEGYLRMVLMALVRAHLVVSVKGPHGGYRLARPAEQISLLEVVEGVDGPVRGDAPPVKGGDGRLDRRLQTVCDQAAAVVRRKLVRVSLAELAGTRK